MNEKLHASPEVKTFIKLPPNEGLRLVAYQLQGEKYWTIGYGHHGPDVKPNQKITKARAEELFETDILEAENIVKALIKVELNQHQFDALVSFTFNAGGGNLARASFKTNLNNRKDYLGVPAQLKRWVYSGKPLRVTQGLVRRRHYEGLIWQGRGKEVKNYHA